MVPSIHMFTCLLPSKLLETRKVGKLTFYNRGKSYVRTASNTLVGFLLLLFLICKGSRGESDTITFKDLFETCQHFLAKAI